MPLSPDQSQRVEAFLEDGRPAEALRIIDASTPNYENVSKGDLLLKVNALYKLERFQEVVDLTADIDKIEDREDVTILFLRLEGLEAIKRESDFQALLDYLEHYSDADVADSAIALHARLLPLAIAVEYLETRKSSWGPRCVIYYCGLMIDERRFDEVLQLVATNRTRFPLYEADFNHVVASIGWLRKKSRASFEELVKATFKLPDNEYAFLWVARMLILRGRDGEASRLIDAAMRVRPRSIYARKLKLWCLLMEKRFREWFSLRREIKSMEQN